MKKTLKLILFTLMFLIITFISFNFKVVRIDGNSMIPTFSNNELKIMKKHTFYEKGDVIVFHYKNEKHIKRIVGLPNDRIKIENNNLFICNNEIEKLSVPKSNNTYTLKKDEYYVLGDNYKNSFDSREHGPIKKSQIIGKVI